MRTRKSIINMAAGFFGQLLNLILAVVGRSILARYMPSEYLGINGLFSNVLSILSLADLGIGAAMMYALYSPVARENREEIRRLMNLYRLLYRWRSWGWPCCRFWTCWCARTGPLTTWRSSTCCI